jgi:hypothetical protein
MGYDISVIEDEDGAPPAFDILATEIYQAEPMVDHIIKASLMRG